MLAALFLSSLAIANAVDLRQVNDEEFVRQINQKATTWTAGLNENFDGRTYHEVRHLMGWNRDLEPAQLGEWPGVDIDAPPASFDSRQHWPGLIGPVLNQADCGSCWAFGATEAISDRFAIQNGTTFVQLAPLTLTTCDNMCDGCDGGEPGAAWQYAQENGLVTEACYPYGTWEKPPGPIPTCPPSQQPCLNFVNTPECTQTCNGNNQPWSQSDKYFVDQAYGVSGEDQYMKEISTNGPIEVCFSVYADFVHYKSGVYQHTTGDYLGGHCVKAIGYGTLNNTPYWLIQNSWTTTWGDKGYFMILRGQDECGIEQGGVAGTVTKK